MSNCSDGPRLVIDLGHGKERMQFELRQHAQEALLHLNGEGFARHHRGAQRAEALRCRLDLRQQHAAHGRHHAHQRDAFLLDDARGFLCVEARHHHQTRPRAHHVEQALECGAVRQRRGREDAVGRGEIPLQAVDIGGQHDVVGLRDDRALGLAGRARGVRDHAVVEFGRDLGQVHGAYSDEVRKRVLALRGRIHAQAQRRQRARLRQQHPRFVLQHQRLGRGVAEDIGHFRRGQLGIQGDRNGAGLDHAHEGDNKLGAVGKGNGHAIADGDAARGEAASQPGRLLVDLAETEAHVARISYCDHGLAPRRGQGVGREESRQLHAPPVRRAGRPGS